MKVAFFRTGTHTDSRGRIATIDSKELDRRIALYNEQRAHEAPIVIGHPETNDPAYGWVDRLFREGDVAYAETRDVQPEFTDIVRRKLYKKISASFYGSGLLRHIGFLGARPPSVKGLPAVEFAGDDEQQETYEYADRDVRLAWTVEAIRESLRGLREYIIESDGREKADAVLPAWRIDAVTYEPETEEAEPNFSEGGGSGPEGDQPTPPPGTAPPAEYADRVATLENDLAAERAAREREREEHLERERRAEIASYLEAPEMRGRVTPAMRDAVAEMLLHCDTVQFAEEGVDDATLGERLRGLLAQLPLQADFVETVVEGGGGRSTDEESGCETADEYNRRNRR